MVGHVQTRDFQGQRLADVISNGLPLRDGAGQSSEIGIWVIETFKLEFVV